MRQQLDLSQPWELTTTQQERLQRDIMPAYQRQVERCAKEVSIQRTAEDIVGAILRFNQSTEGKQAMERERRQQEAARKTVGGDVASLRDSFQKIAQKFGVRSGESSGMITRSYSREEQARAFIAQHRGDLARSSREMAELKRQVQRERAGYR